MENYSPSATSIIQAQPELMNRFQVISLLGEGSAGVVYHVLDRERQNQEMALKILVNRKAFDENTLVRFQREIQVCQKLRHPNLVEAYDLLEVGHTIAYTMEFVSGLDLGKICAHARLDYAEIDRIIGQLLLGLGELHRNSIVHRDVKLENVLMCQNGTIKLGDLGLIKLCDSRKITRTGILLGTAQYMPPEYIKESLYEPSGDVYAVGIALYEMLTGKRRLAGKAGMEAIQYLLKTDFKISKEPLYGAPEKYLQIFEGATCADVKKRYQNASEMLDAFRAACEGRRAQNLEIAPGLNIHDLSDKKPRGIFRRLRRVLGRRH